MAKPQTRTVPILEAGVRDPGAAGLPAALLGVWTVVPQCVCVLTSASEGTASWDRRLPQSVAPFYLNYLFKGPFAKYDHIPSCWGQDLKM